MSRRAAAILLATLAAGVGALLFVNRSGLPRLARRPRPFLRVTPAPPPIVTAPPGATPQPAAETVRVTLFFPDQTGAQLYAEERDLPKPAGGSVFLRALFAELQKGPTREGLIPALPPKMQLRNAFLLHDGEAVLDLAVDSGLTYGSEEELLIVASLVDTVLQNVADTTRVRILVNGEPAETLGGHVDLTRPLLYLRSVVAPPPPADAETTPAPSPTP